MKSKKRLYQIGLVLILLFLAIAFTWHIASNKNQDSKQKDLQSVISLVGKHYLLPTNEQPTLATVEDKSKLSDKFLTEKSENGDRVLIYSKNRLVIIYRPSIHKIAAIGIVSADPALPEANGTTITVLDGDNNPQKTKQIIDKIQKSYPSMKVSSGKANRQDFPNTIVIDNTNSKDNLSEALVSILPAKHGIVPLGEAKQSTDLEIIVGAD